MNAALVFRQVRWALLGLLAMLAAGAAAVHLSTRLHEHVVAEQRQALAARADAQSKLSRARDEEQELRATAARYDELQRRGILGEERRLDWIEHIRAIRDEYKLIDVQYEIAPEQDLPGIAGERYRFMASTMRLRLMMLHEEDLQRLLDDLPRDVSAHVRARRCSIERLPAPAQASADTARLKAECELDWITVRDTRREAES